MTVAIVLLTYNRLSYAKRTLESVLDNIATDQGVVVHIASDGDTPKYINTLVDLAAKQHYTVTVSNSERGGYGRNFNLAMQTTHLVADWVLPLEDDWELLHLLDIDELIADMQDLNFECARLGYMGWTQPLQATVRQASSKRYWLDLDPASPEPHVFAGHPRLESVAFEKRVGPWPEGLTPGETEFQVAHMPEARVGVGWPLDVVHPKGDLFAHIGTKRSY